MVEIVELPPERWEDLRRLRLEALKLEPLAYGSSYEEEQNLSRVTWQARISRVLFAVVDNNPVGIIRYDYETHQKNGHVANIYSVYVNKKYRNQGIGNQLMSSVIKKIREKRGIRKVKLTVNPAQESAVKLYQKHGFNSVGVCKDETCINGKFYDELVMEKYF